MLDGQSWMPSQLGLTSLLFSVSFVSLLAALGDSDEIAFHAEANAKTNAELSPRTPATGDG